MKTDRSGAFLKQRQPEFWLVIRIDWIIKQSGWQFREQSAGQDGATLSRPGVLFVAESAGLNDVSCVVHVDPTRLISVSIYSSQFAVCVCSPHVSAT